MSVESIQTRSEAARSAEWYPAAKRAMDVVLSALALLILSPLFLILIALVYLQDRGPVFYRQFRVGRDGVPFAFYKFRSMVVDADRIKQALADRNEAEGPIFKMRHDPRITPVGRALRRCSLDELPQLWNVLRGDMSLVGPRPHLPAEIASCPDYPRERLGVPPGLVCLREVGGRSHLTFDQWLATDLDYVRRRSFWLDLAILLRAVPAVVCCRGAY